jgi:hypothetical protein
MKIILLDLPPEITGVVNEDQRKPSLCFIGTKQARCIVNAPKEVSVIRVGSSQVKELKPIQGFESHEDPIGHWMQYFNTVLKPNKHIYPEVDELLDYLDNGKDDFPNEPTPLFSRPPTPDTLKKRAEETPPPKPRTKKPKKKKSRGGETSIVSLIAQERGIAPAALRRKLRKQGLKAPYTRKQIEGVLK